MEVFGCQGYTVSLSGWSLKSSRDHDVTQKFTRLSAVVVTITHRRLDLLHSSDAETSCVRLAPFHPLEMPKQGAPGQSCSTAGRRSHRTHSPKLSPSAIHHYCPLKARLFLSKSLPVSLASIISTIPLLASGFWCIFLLIHGKNIHFELCGMTHNYNLRAPGSNYKKITISTSLLEICPTDSLFI